MSLYVNESIKHNPFHSYSSQLTLQGGLSNLIEARYVVVGLMAVAAVALLLFALTIGNVFQLTNNTALLWALYLAVFLFFLIAAIVYGLLEARPLQVERHILGRITLAATIIFFGIFVAVLLDGFQPSTTDLQQTLLVLNGLPGGVAGILTIYLALPA